MAEANVPLFCGLLLAFAFSFAKAFGFSNCAGFILFSFRVEACDDSFDPVRCVAIDGLGQEETVEKETEVVYRSHVVGTSH